MATTEDVREALTDLADRAGEKEGPDPRVAYRRAVAEAGRSSSRVAWLRVAAVALVLAGIGAGLFAWLASDEEPSNVITEPEPPEEPEGESAPAEPDEESTVTDPWTSVEGVPLDAVFRTNRVISDGSSYFALSEGRLLRSTGGIEWEPMTSMQFPISSAGGSNWWPAAAHDGTVLVFEADAFFSTLMVHVVGPDGAVSSTELADTGGIKASAAIGGQGMLIVAGPVVHRSEDGVSWEQLSTSVSPGSALVAIDGGFVLASPDETDQRLTNFNVYGFGTIEVSFSPDGRTWEKRIATDAAGNPRYTEFIGLSPFRGGAAAWTDAGVWLIGEDGAGAGFLDYPEWAVPQSDPCCSAGPLGLFGGGAGLVFVNGFIDQGDSLDASADIAISDGVNWTSIPLPNPELYWLESSVITTSESVLVVDRSTAWATSAVGLGSVEFPTFSPQPAVVAAEQLARDYMTARDLGDGAAALPLFADDAQIVVDGLGFADSDEPQSAEEHARGLEFYAATDWRWTVDSCAGREDPDAVRVTCRYRHSNAWSRALASDGVMGAGEIDFEIRDSRIARLDHTFALHADELPIDLFRAWSAISDFVGANHPDDVEIMFESSDAPSFTPESLALWALYTDEFVADR